MIQIPNSLKQTLLIQDSKSAQASQCVEVSLLGGTDGFFWVVNVSTYKVILTFQHQVCCMIGYNNPYLPWDMGDVHNSVS